MSQETKNKALECLAAGLQNDHKALMKEIEVGLHQIHAAARAAKGAEGGETVMDTTPAPSLDSKMAFVRVDRVDADSPAASAVSIAEHQAISFYKLDYEA